MIYARATSCRDAASRVPLAIVGARKLAIGAAVALLAAGMTPAVAASTPGTRLVRCGSEDCLLVTGHRDSANSVVRINGHAVPVEGQRNWRVRLPIATVKGWALPFARRVEVSSGDGTADQVTRQQAELPIGFMGHVPDLANLVITLH
jgi:hypothetical protein